MPITVPLTCEEIPRLQNCSICGIEKGFFVCQSEKCPNKDQQLYCQKCGKDNHSHGVVRIQNLQFEKSLEWKAIKLMILKIDTSSSVEYKKWREPIELLESISQKHKIKPAKSIYEDIDRFAQIKRDSGIIQEQIEDITFNFRIQELLEMDGIKEEY